MERTPRTGSTRLLLIAALLFPAARAVGDDVAVRSPEEIARASRAAVVVIRSTDRQGGRRGLGTGFIVRSDGVIATNHHVIGDRRPVEVQLSDGRSYTPVEVLAVDRQSDLALIRIDADTGDDFPVIAMGDSDALDPGQEVLAIGNPLGLEWSVSKGVVAARRVVEGRQMIQVAIPIEPGSSGSPLIDRQGRAVGILTIKTGGALGFAVPINWLKTLLDGARPIPMSRWLTIGALDTSEWRALFGGHWTQRAGRLRATGRGVGFGGRMLCLSERTVPETFELEVEVRLGDESGAAGLVFHSDSGHRHHGFYPTNGSLRLTRFEGPDVYSWTILETVPSEAYLPGHWNRIRLRVDGGQLTCSVNGAVVIEVRDETFSGGKVGLVKFREPSAEFRGFRVGVKLESADVSSGVASKVETLLAGVDLGQEDLSDLVAGLAEIGAESHRALLDGASALERRAAALRQLSGELHQKLVLDRLRGVLDAGEGKVDLLHAALLVSKLDNADLEVEAYRERVDRMAGVLRRRLPEGATAEKKIAALTTYLFDDLGYHASFLDYYQRSNSYLDEVLEDREGVPITLSVVFMELGRRVDLPVAGIGLPRHFIVAHRPGKEDEKLIDPFGGGKVLTRQDASRLIGVALGDLDFGAASAPSIIARMLRNLINVAEFEQDREGVLRYLDAIISIEASSPGERWRRAQIRFQTGDFSGLSEDVDWLLENKPEGLDMEVLENLKEFLRARFGK